MRETKGTRSNRPPAALSVLLMALVLGPSTGRATCPPGDLASCTVRCDGGDAASCSSLGKIYMGGGRGVGRDDRRAVEYLQKACDGGSAEGCSNLRRMHAQGRGVGRQYDAESAARQRRSCEAGSAAACADLGRSYELGRGVVRDPRLALELYRKACDGGHTGGCRRACAAGDQSGCERARELPSR